MLEDNTFAKSLSCYPIRDVVFVYRRRTLAHQHQEQPNRASQVPTVGSGEILPNLSASAPPLLIEPEDDVNSVVLVVHGEIDLATAPQLENALAGAVSSAGPPRIVVDLAAVEFIDSTGLQTLLQAQTHATSNGRTLILRHIPAQAKRVFEISGVSQVFVTE